MHGVQNVHDVQTSNPHGPVQFVVGKQKSAYSDETHHHDDDDELERSAAFLRTTCKYSAMRGRPQLSRLMSGYLAEQRRGKSVTTIRNISLDYDISGLGQQ